MPISMEALGLEPVSDVNLDIFRDIQQGYLITRQAIENNLYRVSGFDAFGQPMTETVHGLFVPQAPHIWIPKLSVPEALVVGAAAAVIQNPVVTRRFWQGWFK